LGQLLVVARHTVFIPSSCYGPELIPDPLQRYWWRARSQTANGSGIRDC